MSSLEEDMKMFRELPETIEKFRRTQHENLRVLTGGKGTEPPSTGWLADLAVRTQFACRLNNKTIDWEMYFLYHKFSDIYLLKMEMPDGSGYERRVDPVLFSNMYRDYRIIHVYPPLKIEEIEAPKGDENERPNYD